MTNCILITGASSGFGEACARRFAQSGNRLILAARNVNKLNTLASELNCATHVCQLDVRDSESITAMLGGLPEAFSSIDILVNNAGLALGLEPAWDTDLEQWECMLDTNCKGLIRLTRAVLPRMVERNSGHIVNIGSVAGNWPYPGGNVYGATKAFVQQFSRNLRCDLLGKNIRVSNIEPGMADTNFSLTRFSGDQEKADKVYDGTQPLTAEDIAETIYWVCSVPKHVNINTLELMPTCQAWSPFAVNREMG
jgi:3-hydroxy acid dehydrogenase/malonic semialdehyde reductase